MTAFAASTALRVSRNLVQHSSCKNPRYSIRNTRRTTRAQLDLSSAASSSDLPSGGIPLEASKEDKLLGELMFCEPDSLKALVAQRHKEINNEFYEYIDEKVDESKDFEERESLRLLKDALKQLKKELPLSIRSSEPKVEKKSAQAKAVDEYHALIDSFLDARKREGGLKSSIVIQYERIDFRMLELLEERISDADTDSKRNALKEVLECITDEMNVQVSAAASRLEDLFKTPGGFEAMKLKLRTLADTGGLDEPFVLLLKNNQESAQKAGNEAAATMLTQLVQAVTDILERKLPPELKLLRKLLRSDSRDARVDMLMAALKKGKSVAMGDGSMSSGVKVDGKKFVQALRKLIEEYGNVNKEFVKKLSEIGEESEAVARKIYDMEGKDIGEMQKEAFHKRRVSVWDLENVEMAEEAQGRKAGWEGRLGNVPPGFNKDGKMVV